MNIIMLPPSRWEEYKAIRLESLKEEPQAFGMSYERASAEPDEKWKKNLIDATERKTDILYFAEDNDKIIGIMGAFFLKTPETQDNAMIFGAYVSKSHRGQGIGKELLTKILETLSADTPMKKATLMVNTDEEPAKNLYEKMGFVITDTVDYVLGDGKNHQLYKMEKVLQ